MKLVSFFVLSLALHAAALVYPVSFGWRNQAEIIQVVVLPIEQDDGDAGGQGGNGSPSRRDNSKLRRVTPPAAEPGIEPKSLANPTTPSLPAAVTPVSDSSSALVSAIVNSADTAGATISGPTGKDANGSSTGLGGIDSGNGLGSSGTGRGSGNSNSGSSGTGIGLTQASYRDTPRPAYPESARREGRQGRVLLRVLVDDQGRIKQVEINSSSGCDTLDRAASEGIKLWRFHPAHYGDRPVEIWLRIPIEFRLADAKAW